LEAEGKPAEKLKLMYSLQYEAKYLKEKNSF